MEDIIRFYAVLVVVGIVCIVVLAIKGVEDDPVEREKYNLYRRKKLAGRDGEADH